jgi:hemolysin activation/secretion protein
VICIPVTQADPRIGGSAIEGHLGKIAFRGVSVYTEAELLSAIRSSISSSNLDIKSDEFRSKVMRSITEKYVYDGYILSYAENVSYDQKRDVLDVAVVEGRIDNFIIDGQLLEIKYLKGYIDEIVSMKPFNLNEAGKYFLLIRKLLGSRVDLKIKLLKDKKREGNKTADIICTTFYKYDGVFSIHNYQSSSNLTEDARDDISFMTKSGYFTIGDFSLRAANPYNTPSTVDLMFSTSADKKENNVFLSSKYQINKYGTKLTSGIGYNKFNFHVKKDAKFFQIGLKQPIQYKKHTELILYSTLNFIRFSYIVKDGSKQLIKQGDQKTSSNKLVSGFKIKHVSALNIEQIYDFGYHIGKAKVDDIGYKTKHTINFQKYTGRVRVLFNLPKKFKLNFEVDGQYAPTSIPITEFYSPATQLNGKGLLYLDVAARSGYTAIAQLSHFSDVAHPLFFGIDKYVYYDYEVAKFKRFNNIEDKTLGSASLGAIGVGTDLYLVDKLVFNIELSQRLTKRHYDDKIPRTRIFAGLRYHFVF